MSLAKGSTGGDEDFTGTEVIIVEGFAKFRDVKRVRLKFSSTAISISYSFSHYVFTLT